MREVQRTFNEITKTLTQLNNERTLLLANISHNLRTPLTKLQLTMKILPNKINDNMRENIIQNITNMNNIINQFLDFVRDVKDKPIQIININALLKSITDRHTRAGQHIELKIKKLVDDVVHVGDVLDYVFPHVVVDFVG
jgi:Signal transduction histidine kinase